MTQGAPSWIDRPLERRAFLRWAGASGLAVIGGGALAACGDGATTAGKGGSEIGGELNLFTWEGYDAEAPFRAWRNANGIEQSNLGFISTQNDAIAKLSSPSGRRIDATSFNTSFLRDGDPGRGGRRLHLLRRDRRPGAQPRQRRRVRAAAHRARRPGREGARLRLRSDHQPGPRALHQPARAQALPLRRARGLPRHVVTVSAWEEAKASA